MTSSTSVPLPTLGEGSRLAIVGAGSAGVYAAKEALDAGWIPTVFERGSRLGGVWRPGNHWDSLTTNSSFDMMQRGDFAFPFKPSSDFPTRLEICKYVEAFASHFGLDKHINFGTTVLVVEPISPGDSHTAWRVVTESAQGENEATFDAVFVATGQFSIPRLPRALQEGNAGFVGTIAHSHDFRDGAHFAGQRVLVVGIGNSALDVALECAQRGAASVVVACRRGTILLPIMSDDHKALDKKIVSRFWHYAQPKALQAYRLMTEALEVTKQFVAAGMPPPDLEGNALHQRISNLKQKQQWLQMLRAPEGERVLRMHPSGLESCGPGNRVDFFDGSSMEVDAIIACTGYRVDFPFLQQQRRQQQLQQKEQECEDIEEEKEGNEDGLGGSRSHLLGPVVCDYEIPAAESEDGSHALSNAPAAQARALALHRRVMHPQYPTLNFLTQVTCFGNEAIVGGLQARWAVNILSRSGEDGDKDRNEAAGKMEGNRPQRPDMAAISRSCQQLRDRFERVRPLFPNFVTYSKYVDELATDIGCMPPPLSSATTWFEDPLLAYGLLFGPHVEAHHRLSHDNEARDLVMRRAGVGAARL